MTELLQRLARRSVARRFTVIALIAIAAFAVLGALHTLAGLPLDAFDPNGERNAPALFAGALLVAAAVAALAASSVERGRARFPASAMALLLMFLAADELLQLHEKAERLLGVDWQLLYAPVFAVGLILGVVLLRRVWGDRGALLLFLVAGAAWAVSQLLELVEYNAADTRVSGYDLMVVTEEPLEMIGTALLAAALITVAAIRRRALAEPSMPAPAVRAAA